MNTINILYGGDKGIERGLLMSVLSIARNTGRTLRVYVLTMQTSPVGERKEACKPVSGEMKETIEPVSEECVRLAKRMLQSVNPSSSITLIDASEYFQSCPPEKNLSTRFTPGCMLRLYADLEEQIPDKILYLDSDVLCRDGEGLEQLYDTDIAGYEYAAVLDHYGSWFFWKQPTRRDYVNSGVLLLNMARIRQTELFEKCRTACRTKKMFFPDQTALNRLAGEKMLLPGKYNEQRKLHGDTVLQHFSTSFRFFPVLRTVTVKPWEQERVHSVLKLYEYDELFEEYNGWIARYHALCGDTGNTIQL